MWYWRVVGRNVGLPVVASIALVLVDIMVIVNLVPAVDLVVVVRTQAPGMGVATGCSDLGLSGHRARFNALRDQRA